MLRDTAAILMAIIALALSAGDHAAATHLARVRARRPGGDRSA